MLILKSVNFEQREFQNHQLKESRPGQTEWVIGRSTNCDLVIASPEVSRVHGRIVYLNSSYYFVDVGSSSGSLLNGEIVPVDGPRQLQSGDLLQIGETFLYVEEMGGTPASSPAIETSTELGLTPWGTEDITVRCCRIIDETSDVKTFCFVAEPAIQFSYQPGQFVNLELMINGKTVIRPYSISSSPSRPYSLTVTVKRVPSPANQPDVPPGLVSNWLHDNLKAGDRIKLLGGPMGRFTCVPNVPSKILLVSAGSGITPMMSMLRWLQDTMTNCDIIFLHSAASPQDVIFRKELEAIDEQMPNLRVAVTITRPTANQHWMGLTGRISQSMLSVVAPDLMERSVYVCGSEGFMQATRSLLESMNFPMQNYQEESFGGQPTKQAVAPAAPTKQVSAPVQSTAAPTKVRERDLAFAQASVSDFSGTRSNGKAPTLPIAPPGADSVIHFTKSNQQVTVDNNTSILEAAEEEGVQIRHACRAGACGMCKVRVMNGQVRYKSSPTALTIADQQAGYVLTCIACPVSSVEVEA
jgi:ferredoxin-NADP reductase